MSGTTSSRRLAITAAMLFLSSCASRSAASVSRVTSVDLGMTKQDVIELMGEPGLVRQDAIGETWTWTFVESDEWGFLKSKSVSVQIRDGRVFSWHRPSEN